MKFTDNSSAFLKTLEGAELYAVTFVRDYLQLFFEKAGTDIGTADDFVLNAYSWPQVVIADSSVQPLSFGYCDLLRDRIGKQICSAHEQIDDSITLEFSDGVILRIPLGEAERNGPEAVILTNGRSKEWEVW